MIIKNAAATCEPNLWDVEWQFENEYVPDWPNDYEVAVIGTTKMYISLIINITYVK